MVCAEPANLSELQLLSQAWEDCGKLKNDPKTLALLNPRLNSGSRERRPWHRRLVAAAALIAVTVAVGILVSRPDLPVEYRTERGQQRTVVLGDGTQIYLNTESRIAVTAGEKQVRLLAGEASFDVQDQGRQSFSVAAGEQTVRVLGTRFNVFFQPDELVVSVLEGKVAVDLASSAGGEASSQDLVLGQILKIEGSRPLQLTAGGPELDRVRAWRAGKVEFERTALRDVVRELNRYTRSPLRLTEPTLGGLLVSGVFRIDRLADTDALRFALENSLPIRVRDSPDSLDLLPTSIP